MPVVLPTDGRAHFMRQSSNPAPRLPASSPFAGDVCWQRLPKAQFREPSWHERCLRLGARWNISFGRSFESFTFIYGWSWTCTVVWSCARVCDRVFVWSCGRVVVWLCGRVVVWSCGCVVVRSCGRVVIWSVWSRCHLMAWAPLPRMAHSFGCFG